MRKLGFGLVCIALWAICGCEKNDCQTFLQGEWHVSYPGDTSYISRDSVFFYNADSIIEVYRFKASPDSNRIHYSSYFIDDFCDEIDFNSTNTWDSVIKVPQYRIITINGNHFQIISKADSGNCTPCLVTFDR